MTSVLLFDLDETLIVEEPAAVASFQATARRAALSHDLEADVLAISARARARELWHDAPMHGYCRRVGISSWEGLWCRFEGSEPEVRALRKWSPTYRREAWRLALADQGIADPALAEELGEEFVFERRARHSVFTDSVPVLDELSASHPLGLVTNGAACLQREKLDASGLRGYFSVVVVSADLGSAKPDARVFRQALSGLGADHGVMIGDSIEKDVNGALAAGLDAVWLNRTGRDRPDGLEAAEMTNLAELPELLQMGVLRSRSARHRLPTADATTHQRSGRGTRSDRSPRS